MKLLRYFIPLVFYVLVYSLLPHKVRFFVEAPLSSPHRNFGLLYTLFPCLPLPRHLQRSRCLFVHLMRKCQRPLSRLARIRNVHLLRILVVLGIGCSLLVMAVLFLAASENYPGGEALWRLHHHPRTQSGLPSPRVLTFSFPPVCKQRL